MLPLDGILKSSDSLHRASMLRKTETKSNEKIEGLRM
jgi:hypothetical protein